MPNELLARLNLALEADVVSRHSLFQLKHFVLGKETTVQGRIWQCLREIKVRKDSLDSIAFEIEESKDRLELLHIKERQSYRQSVASIGTGEICGSTKDQETHAEEQRAVQIHHRMAVRQVEAAKLALAALEEKKIGYEVEAAFFLEEFEKLTAVTPVKPIDDEDAQKEYWTAKLFQEVQIKSLLGQPLEPDLVKTVLSLPDDSAVKAQMIQFLTSIRDAKSKAVAQEINPALIK